MIASPYLIGIAAGLVAAVLFRSLATNSALALLLFYLTPLPVFLAGIGWGARAALLSFVTATVLLGALLSFQSAIAFGLYIGLPGVVLSYLMLLHREYAVDQGAAGGQPRTIVEWYPFGRIIAWGAVMSGTLIAVGLVLLAGDSETYRQIMRTIFDETALQRFQSVFGAEFGPAEMERFVERFAFYFLPFFAATFWLLIMIGNLWLAAKSASISGLLSRPLPDFTSIDYPPFLVAGFVAALVVSFASGMLGVAGVAFLGAFGCAFLLMGLAVIHVLLASSQFKLVLLFVLYVGLLVTPWVAPPVTALGLAEPFIRLRQRQPQRTPPPDNSGNPPNANL
jgi:hypothetical protein